MWEGGGNALDAYGTPLSLMLLPYWTHGRIGSMEGLYYESSATTPYHFMAVATLSGPGNASNPVRGLDYRTLDDFDLGVRYMRQLGVRYYMAYSNEAKAKADADPDLKLLRRTTDLDGNPPIGWNVYEVRDWALVAPLQYQPVAVSPKAGTQSQCFGRAATPGAKNPELGDWECTAVRWWNDPAALDRPLSDGGPSSWQRGSPATAERLPKKSLPAVTVSRVHETDDAISFHVSRPGVPVVVRTSYYPNWVASGAEGPWRLTPNLMVVVPTSRDVNLRFERTSVEWAGIVATILGMGGVVALALGPRLRRVPEAPGTDRGDGYDDGPPPDGG
jgi:hypothetical protein